MRKGTTGCRNGISETHHGSNYTDDEVELIRAMERWMKEKKVVFPKFTDVLGVAKSLGYRKVV